MRAVRRALRASIFDRKVHAELFFDSDATADAVLLVAGIFAIVFAGTTLPLGFAALSLTGLLTQVIYGVIDWLIIAGATWFVATRLFQGGGHMQTMMRLHGHCELPYLLTLLGPIGAGIGLVWAAAAKVVATSESASLDLIKAGASVLVGVALVFLVRAILRVPFGILGSVF